MASYLPKCGFGYCVFVHSRPPFNQGKVEWTMKEITDEELDAAI